MAHSARVFAKRPGAPDEDTTGDFEHGGWHLRYFDDISRKWVVESYATASGFLLGRRTYENLAGYWPNASEEEQVIAQPLNTRPKYVASRTLGRAIGMRPSFQDPASPACLGVAVGQRDGRRTSFVPAAPVR